MYRCDSIFSVFLCVCVCHNLATTTTTTTTQNHLLRSAATTQVGGKGDRHGVVGRIHSGMVMGVHSLIFWHPIPTLRMTR